MRLLLLFGVMLELSLILICFLFIILLIFKIRKEKVTIKSYDCDDEFEDFDDTDKLYNETVRYNIEEFRERMRRLKESADSVDSDGLYDVDTVPSKDELGFVSGVEIVKE